MEGSAQKSYLTPPDSPVGQFRGATTSTTASLAGTVAPRTPQTRLPISESTHRGEQCPDRAPVIVSGRRGQLSRADIEIPADMLHFPLVRVVDAPPGLDHLDDLIPAPDMVPHGPTRARQRAPQHQPHAHDRPPT
jgi:hypothetical protein